MPLFTETIRAEANGETVGAALFVTFEFKSGPLHIWEGDGPYRREDITWRGMGHRVDGDGNPLQSIDGLEQAINGQSQQLSLTLSGVDETVVTAAKKDADVDEIEGRDVIVRLGFFTDRLVPLDGLVVLSVWIMQKPSFQATGSGLRTITLPCETLFVQRSRSPFSMLTDRDQQRLHPGDTSLVFVPTLQDKELQWPRN
ncbi:hypothetical protein [Inquilinus sp. CA228]|uniref:hypothetical protein n=1 Tax=Inquilinus sp. CA228 TaxID=3455609 RepID=UPI003F8D241C